MGIYIWGTGCGAGELIQQGLDPSRISAFIDNSPSSPSFLGRPVLRPEQLPVEDVELLFVTTRHTKEIQAQCRQLGLREDTLFFIKNHYELQDLNTSYETAEKLLGTSFAAAFRYSCHIIREPLSHPDGPALTEHAQNDYVRLKTLEFLTEMISDVPGAAAELGVYRGAFARAINLLLPDRKLYLFDTFQGFDEQEAQKEQHSHTCSTPFLQAHQNTAAENVLKSMPRPEQIIPRIGLFPQTAQGLQEVFALVSLDADFEETTYAGLSWFWPRLSSGGYILLHDYHSPTLSGVRKAVERYETTQGIRLPKVPLCDIGGTLVLCKP